MSQFAPALAYVLAREGGLEEQSSDPGGITMCGISLRLLKSLDSATLRKYGVSVDAEAVSAADIRALSPEQVSAIYKGEFWDHAPFSEINSQDIANYLFDACVDMGIAPGVKCLQRALWAVRRSRVNLVDDGILGPQTLILVNQLGDYAGAGILMPAMRSERAGEYRLVAQVHPTENIDLEGWLNRSYNQST